MESIRTRSAGAVESGVPMNTPSSLRSLPSVDEMLRHGDLTAAAETLPRALLIGCIRNAVEECRQLILNGADYSADAAIECVVKKISQRVAFEHGRQLQPVINATGILLHTNLGRSPLAQSALKRMHECGGYANVEMNMQTGKRNKRGERVAHLLAELTTAEDAVVVNNCAAATMLTLQTLAAGREVIVSRSQLVEIGGGYRLPEVFTASGAVLKEVGTTNRSYVRDYEQAINENTAAILRVHRSNLYLGGFVTEPTIAELVALGGRHEIPVVDDVGSGCITALGDIGLKEPVVSECIAAGADLVLFSGDKLFCGPQAGLIVGRRKFTTALRASPMMRALRADKTTIAALEATTEIHLSGNGQRELPLLRMLSAPAADVRRRAEEIESLIGGTPPSGAKIEIVESVAEIGGGSVPGSKIPSFALQVTGVVAETLASRLRCGQPSVVGRIQGDRLLMDVRSVADDQVSMLAEKISRALIDCEVYEA